MPLSAFRGENMRFPKLAYIVEMNYNIKFHDHKLSGADVASTTKFSLPACWYY
jgi:hypothetical protein